MAFSHQELCLGRGVAGIRPFAIESSLLAYFIQAEAEALNDAGTGTTFRQINKDTLASWPLSLPPLSEQRRIAAKLDSLFDRTQRARTEVHRSLSLLDHLEQATLSKAFRGDLTADWRDARGLTKELGTRSKESGGISKLPTGWVETTIGEVIETFQVIDPKKKPDKEFVYIDIGSIDNRRQAITTPKVFCGKDAPSRARRVVQSGDVLFSTVRTYLKNIAVVPSSLDGCLTSTGIAVLRPSQAIETRYLFRWVTSEPFISNMSQAQDGTMYPAVTDKDVHAGVIVLPPLKEQWLIVAKLDSLLARTQRARSEAHRSLSLLDHLEQGALSKAFRGELVPQDPNDESSSALLERIRAERATKPKLKRGRCRIAH